MSKIKVHVLLTIAIAMTFLFGFEIATNKEKITYDLYKFTKGGVDWTSKPVNSPQDRISEDQIYVLKDKIEIMVPGAEWSAYEPTGSMEPLINEKANGLYILPKGPEDIQPGDIIAYTYDETQKDVVHRVVGVEKDEHGNYFYITKGDANPVPDPDPVPYTNIKRILIGVIY